MTDISPMILASALANLSPTRLTSGVIGLQSGPKPFLQGRDSWPDAGQSDRWRPTDHHYRSASLDNGGASSELVPKMTPKAGQSRPSALERWEHPKLHPLGDEGVGAMMQIH